MIKGTLENCKRNTLRYFILNILLFNTGIAFAQNSPKESINDVISAVSTFTNHQSIEKLYLQTDKPSYATGDTLWFKGYLFDATYFNAAMKSGILYVEVANDSNRVVKRIMLPVYGGLTRGQIALDQKEMPQGGYVLRAYTSWMRNFGEDYVFKKPFYISNATDKGWLVNYNVQVENDGNRDKIQLHLRLNQLNKNPLGLRAMQIRITDEKKTGLRMRTKPISMVCWT